MIHPSQSSMDHERGTGIPVALSLPLAVTAVLATGLGYLSGTDRGPARGVRRFRAESARR